MFRTWTSVKQYHIHFLIPVKQFLSQYLTFIDYVSRLIGRTFLVEDAGSPHSWRRWNTTKSRWSSCCCSAERTSPPPTLTWWWRCCRWRRGAGTYGCWSRCGWRELISVVVMSWSRRRCIRWVVVVVDVVNDECHYGNGE